jgi:uncharacterized protein YjbK
MNLEFKIYEVKEGNRSYKQLIEKFNLTNEFVAVGEELIGGKLDCYKMHSVDENGIKFIGDLKIDECTMNIPKDDLRLQTDDNFGYNTYEFDIPRKYLTLEAIEEIQRLNE